MKESTRLPRFNRNEAEKFPTTIQLQLDTKVKVLNMAKTTGFTYNSLIKKCLSLGFLVIGYKERGSAIFESEVFSGKRTELTVQVTKEDSISYKFGNAEVQTKDKTTVLLIGERIPDTELTEKQMRIFMGIAKLYGQDITVNDVAEGMIELGLRIISDSIAKTRVYHLISEKGVEIIDDILDFPLK